MTIMIETLTLVGPAGSVVAGVVAVSVSSGAGEGASAC
jgi:hypothetical protein